MRRLASFVLASAVVLAAGPGGAADDAAGAFVCGFVDVFDCSAGDCVEMQSEIVRVPDVLRIDPAAKTMTALDKEFGGASSPVDSIATEDGRTMVRAKQGDRSFVLSVEATSGDAILAVTDAKLSLVAYGECAAP